jgi:hypothetical protein
MANSSALQLCQTGFAYSPMLTILLGRVAASPDRYWTLVGGTRLSESLRVVRYKAIVVNLVCERVLPRLASTVVSAKQWLSLAKGMVSST